MNASLIGASSLSWLEGKELLEWFDASHVRQALPMCSLSEYERAALEAAAIQRQNGVKSGPSLYAPMLSA
jgi:hypothetical protein